VDGTTAIGPKSAVCEPYGSGAEAERVHLHPHPHPAGDQQVGRFVSGDEQAEARDGYDQRDYGRDLHGGCSVAPAASQRRTSPHCLSNGRL
jgi:hypothetical protein